MNVRILLAPNPSAFTLDGTRTYLLGTDVVIDPGPAMETHVERILEEQPELTTIFVTHRHSDHAPAASLIKARRQNIRIIAPAGAMDAQFIDDLLIDGACYETASTTICAIATPGHTAESFCFLTSDAGLFSGDTILGSGTSAIFPPDGRLSDYLHSLAKLRKLNARVIYPGHGPQVDDPSTLIDGYLAHRQKRLSEIRSVLDAGPSSIPALREKIYPPMSGELQRAADAQLLAHLIYLVEQGQVREEAGIYATNV